MKVIERRPWDIGQCFCDTTKIKAELWFETQIGLEESIKNSWNFYNK
jgi:UDP-glucose 4-epimerase